MRHRGARVKARDETRPGRHSWAPVEDQTLPWSLQLEFSLVVGVHLGLFLVPVL